MVGKAKKRAHRKCSEKAKEGKVEYLELQKVYSYVQDILKYSKPLSPQQVLLLQNLRAGQLVRRGTKVFLSKSGYPYEVILLTMKAIRPQIDNAMLKLQTSKEIEKTKYMIAMVANNINDIYLRWENSKKQDNNILKILEEDIEVEPTYQAEYVQTKKDTSLDMNELW